MRVEPCRAPAEDNEPCIFKRHETVKIEFAFIARKYLQYFMIQDIISAPIKFFVFHADFNASTLGHQAYSATIVDLPMPNMDSGDACEYTDCPVKAERKQTYKFQVEMLPFFPLLRYTLKWRLWNRDLEDDVQDCCFLMQIKLIR